MTVDAFLTLLTIFSLVGTFTLGYITGFVAGKRRAFKDAKVQNPSDLKDWR